MKYIKILLLLSLSVFVFCSKKNEEKTIVNSNQVKSSQINQEKKFTQKDIKKAIELNQKDFVTYIDTTKSINKFYQFEEFDRSYTMLGYCCKLGRYDFIKELISRKADISLGTADEYYEFDALYAAIEGQNEKIVNLLLENKANANSTYTESGLSPLSLACKSSNFKIVEALIIHKADIKGNYNPESEMACFPILEAVIFSKNKEIIKLLLEKGADVNQVDLEGVSALSYAKTHDQDIYDFLLKNSK